MEEKHNKPLNKNASKKRWYGLANYAGPLTERYVLSIRISK
tara:strand:+ start:890 stop:1012 length:123 start_codon:yes stop_codon:yes gene_type:complete